MSPPGTRTIRQLLDAIADTPLGAEMRDPQKARERIYRELAQEDDPLLREIGEQLRDGVLRPHQLLDIPAYRTVVEQRLELLRQRPVDPDAVRAALADYLDSPAVTKPDGGSGQ
jgi:hypothetical protein